MTAMISTSQRMETTKLRKVLKIMLKRPKNREPYARKLRSSVANSSYSHSPRKNSIRFARIKQDRSTIPSSKTVDLPGAVRIRQRAVVLSFEESTKKPRSSVAARD
jgi:hypothetical protein